MTFVIIVFAFTDTNDDYNFAVTYMIAVGTNVIPSRVYSQAVCEFLIFEPEEHVQVSHLHHNRLLYSILQPAGEHMKY